MARNIFFKRDEDEYSIYTINNRDTRLRKFDKIETKEDAYFIGYMLGDGGFSASTHKRSARMSLVSKDKYIIEYFKNKYQPDTKIYSKIPINNIRPEIVSVEESHRITFSSYYSDVFEKYGILSHKNDRKIQNIPEKFMRHYILGFLDADGSISYHTQQSNDRFRVGVKFTHPSYDVLRCIKDYLNKELVIGGTIHDKKGENCRCLSISGLLDVVSFVNWLYYDSPEIYNKRKFEVAESLKSEYLSRYFATKEKVIGVTLNDAYYTPFAVINKKKIVLGNFKSYDEAVQQRLCFVAKRLNDIDKNSWYYYNPITNTFQLTYLSHDDNLTTFIEVSLDGQILQFTKLQN